MHQDTTGSSQPSQKSNSISQSESSGIRTSMRKIDSTFTSTEENKKQDKKKG